MKFRLQFISAWIATLCIATSALAIDTTNPMANIEAWVKLAGDTSGKTVYRLNRGVAYAMPKDAMSQPLLGMEGLTISRFIKLPDGGYQEQQVGCGLYFDPKTNAYVTEMINPLTGKMVKFKSGCGNISGAKFTKDGMQMAASFEMESSVFNKPYLLQWTISGDRAVIKREAHTRWVEPSSKKQKFEITVDTYVASVADLENPARTSVDAYYSWVSQTEWLTLLGMGDRPGNLLWMMDGQKYKAASELPEKFRKAFEAAYPGKLDNPFPAAK